MLGDLKGYATTDKELKFTTYWPSSDLSIVQVLSGKCYDMKQDYIDALTNKANLPVVDISVDGDEYLVLGDGKESGKFLWSINKRDVILFIPAELIRSAKLEIELDKIRRQTMPELTKEQFDAIIKEMKTTTGLDYVELIKAWIR